MDQMLATLWEQLTGRVGGPLTMRFVLQPTIATILAIRAGMKDARAHKSPYLWTVLSNPAERPQLLRDGFKDVAKVFTLAIVFDVAYQLIVLKWIYPLQALLIAATLALVPYALIRGPITRFFSRR